MSGAPPSEDEPQVVFEAVGRGSKRLLDSDDTRVAREVRVNASGGPGAGVDPPRGIPARVVVASGTTLSAVRLSLIADACHGHQMCAIAAPELFGSDELGNAVILVEGDVPAHLEAKARRAEANCPERAIVVLD